MTNRLNFLKRAARFMAVALCALSALYSCSDDDSVTDPAKITMVANSETVNIYLSGSGEASINWGDGSKLEAFNMSTDEYRNHIYSGTFAHTIRIYGENITILYCSGNQLTSLDVSNNTILEVLLCFSNDLTSLDVKNNTALTVLDCMGNSLPSLDISNNKFLTHLNCGANQLTVLDVHNNTALTSLSLLHNYLMDLDISNNTELTLLDLWNNQITNLDVSNNTALIYLSCLNNQLTGLDISHNTVLKKLDCKFNKLTNLDVSHNTALASLDCKYNQFSIDGLNSLFSTLHGNALENKTIYIDGNLGTASCDRSIATAKGWIVVYD